MSVTEVAGSIILHDVPSAQMGHGVVVNDQLSPARSASFGGREAAEIAGITYRQLDYWARTHLVTPSLGGASGSGSPRRYSYDDVVMLAIARTLIDCGKRLERVRQIFDWFHGPGDDPETAHLVVTAGDAFVVRGHLLCHVVRERQREGVINILWLGAVTRAVDVAIESMSASARLS